MLLILLLLLLSRPQLICRRPDLLVLLAQICLLLSVRRELGSTRLAGTLFVTIVLVVIYEHSGSSWLLHGQTLSVEGAVALRTHWTRRPVWREETGPVAVITWVELGHFIGQKLSLLSS